MIFTTRLGIVCGFLLWTLGAAVYGADSGLASVNPDLASIRRTMIFQCKLDPDVFPNPPTKYELSDLRTHKLVVLYVLGSVTDSGNESMAIGVAAEDGSVSRCQVIPHLEKIIDVVKILVPSVRPNIVVARSLESRGIGTNAWWYVLLGVVDGKPEVVLQVKGDFIREQPRFIREQPGQWECVTRLAFERLEAYPGADADSAILLGFEVRDGKKTAFARVYDYDKSSCRYQLRDQVTSRDRSRNGEKAK